MVPPLNAKTTLLQALAAGDGYGLELITRVSAWTGGRFVLHQGSVYPALRSLERDGLVHSYTCGPISEKGGRPRIYYSLTDLGCQVADDHSRLVSSLFENRPTARAVQAVPPLQRSA